MKMNNCELFSHANFARPSEPRSFAYLDSFGKLDLPT